MRKVLKRVLPQSLRRRLRASVRKLAVPYVRGNLDLAFRVGNDHLFMDGWLVGPVGQISAVRVLDENGNPAKVSFAAVYQYRRQDVVDAFKDTVPDSYCVAYRMLIKLPYRNPTPAAVTIQTSNGSSFVQRIGAGYTATLTRISKIEKLSELADNPTYNRVILVPSESLLEQQTAFEGHVEGLYQGKDGSMLVFGWIDDNGQARGEGRLSDPKTSQELSSAEMFRYPRADLSPDAHEHLGMLLFIKAPGRTPPFGIQFRSETGGEVLLAVNEESPKHETLLDNLLSRYEQCRRAGLPGAEKQRLSSLFIPMIERVYIDLQEPATVAEEVQFGAPNSEARVSIVIPIYKAYELMRNQMAGFSLDPFFTRQDIILVLDSPEDSEQFKLWISRLYDLYKVPVRVLIMDKSGGFSRACNAGASAANALFLLFLNSDVFPKHPGWLESMLARMKEDASVSVVGARLLYPDESIQHAGITWRQKAALDYQLVNYHPWKGMEPCLVPDRGAAEVPAVTAACLLCRTDEFRSLGMFDEGYIQGDYEDSDFCLRVRERGKRVVCDNEAVLYHVEGNSYPSEDRRKVFFYNAMRHEMRWGALIAQLTHRDPKEEKRGMIEGTMCPIFIVGAPRSGTSAMVTSLIRGAGLAGYNEGHVLPLLNQLHQTVDDYFAALDGRILAPEIKDKQLIGQLDAEGLKNFITSKFVQIIEERLGSDLWVDKTPGAPMLAAVPGLAAIFPQARFVFAKRRGIENVLSRITKFPGQSFENQCKLWAQCMDLWLPVRAGLPRERYIEVDLRDIALHPEETAERVGSFLGLSSEQIGGIRSMWLSERPEQARAAQDYRYIGLNETDWSAEEKAIFVRVCGSSMEQYGYPLEEQVFPEAYERPVYLYYPIAGVVEGEVSTENVTQEGFRPFGRGFRLHTIWPGKDPAKVRYHGLVFSGHNHFSGLLQLNNPESEPVEYRLLIERSADRTPVCEHYINVSVGQKVQWEVPLPALREAYDVVVSTAMAGDAKSNHEVWAIWKRPHFSIRK